MTLFTVGPVQMYPETLKTEGTQPPYFRTEEFSRIMKEIEKNFLSTIHAPEGAGFAALTASGTGAMDAALLNTLTKDDKVLVINGGSFGKRFADICKNKLGLDTTTYDIGYLKPFSKEEFEKYEGKGFTALLVNFCETGTGQLYDLDYLGEFCRSENIFFIADAVSAYLADPIDMKKQGIDVLFTASQKALALSPGIAPVALSPGAIERSEKGAAPYYFDFNDYLNNQKRGQTPFTPAVSTLLALHERLQAISEAGIDNVNALHRKRAEYFREKAARLPVIIPDIPLSSCLTPLIFPENNASRVYEALSSEHDIYLTPSGGDLKDLQLRVGHLGNLSFDDFDRLLGLLEDIL